MLVIPTGIFCSEKGVRGITESIDKQRRPDSEGDMGLRPGFPIVWGQVVGRMLALKLRLNGCAPSARMKM